MRLSPTRLILFLAVLTTTSSCGAETILTTSAHRQVRTPQDATAWPTVDLWAAIGPFVAAYEAEQQAEQQATEAAQVRIASASSPVVVPQQPTSSTAPSSGDIAYCIRTHEWDPSEGYATNTGNGFYGAYQYTIGTWNGYGGYYYPNQAPPSVQDAKFYSDWNNEDNAGREHEWPNSSRACGF